MVDFGRKSSSQFFRIQQRVNAELATEQFVTALNIELNAPVAHNGKHGHVAHIPKVSLQLINIDSRDGIGLGREDINAMTVEHHTNVNIIERAFGHEVMNIHVLDIDTCTIAQVFCIETTVKRQDATTLTGFDVG